MKNQGPPYRKIILLIVIALVLIIGGAITYNVLKNAEVNILVAPANATVKIENKEYTNGSYRLFPKDNVKVTISADGFEDMETEIDLKSHETTLIRAVLTDNDNGYSAYLNSNDDFTLLQLLAPTINNPSINELVSKVNTASEIINILPVNATTSKYYRDQHGFIVTAGNGTIIQIMQTNENCTTVIPCLMVYDSDNNLDNVKNYIREQGYEPDLYTYQMQNKTMYDPVYLDPRYDEWENS